MTKEAKIYNGENIRIIKIYATHNRAPKYQYMKQKLSEMKGEII